MSTRPTVEVILEVFQAIEQRDAQRFADATAPDFEIHWPPSLPYGGSYPDHDVTARRGRPTWTETWTPLQPTVEERRMDPSIVAANNDTVVVLWQQRGVHPDGERLDTPVLGLYRVHEGRLARAQMFYFDTAAVATFLDRATRERGIQQ